jgi:hypothetical protein
MAALLEHLEKLVGLTGKKDLQNLILRKPANIFRLLPTASIYQKCRLLFSLIL